MRIVPTVLTLIGATCAIAACLLLLGGSQPVAFGLIIVAMILDMLDGPLARRFKLESKLGAWLDSLADVFIYLAFPALFWYLAYNIHPAILALFVGGGCLRLLRFSLGGLEEHGGKLSYSGMPVYYDQALLACSLAFALDARFLSVLLVVVSGLAVSTVPFVKQRISVLSMGLAAYAGIIILRLWYAS